MDAGGGGGGGAAAGGGGAAAGGGDAGGAAEEKKKAAHFEQGNELSHTNHRPQKRRRLQVRGTSFHALPKTLLRLNPESQDGKG